MTHSVQWDRRALDALTAIWLDNPARRTAINEAVVTTDRLLQIDPGTQGESRDGGRRVVFVSPLVVIFRANDAKQEVRVVDVRNTKRRGTL